MERKEAGWSQHSPGQQGKPEETKNGEKICGLAYRPPWPRLGEGNSGRPAWDRFSLQKIHRGAWGMPGFWLCVNQC
jgi:hypothetical protein